MAFLDCSVVFSTCLDDPASLYLSLHRDDGSDAYTFAKGFAFGGSFRAILEEALSFLPHGEDVDEQQSCTQLYTAWATFLRHCANRLEQSCHRHADAADAAAEPHDTGEGEGEG